jgi:hypothetical protein
MGMRLQDFVQIGKSGTDKRNRETDVLAATNHSEVFAFQVGEEQSRNKRVTEQLSYVRGRWEMNKPPKIALALWHNSVGTTSSVGATLARHDHGKEHHVPRGLHAVQEIKKHADAYAHRPIDRAPRQ